MNIKEKIESNSLQQKNIIGKWLEEEMLEISKSLRTEFYELGEVSIETKKRLKEVLEDKKKGRSLQKFSLKKQKKSRLMNL
jgi:hypothetical protein